MTGPQLLKRYLRETKQRPSAFGDAAGIDRSLLCRWLSGQRRPGMDLAVKLEGVTGGAVPAMAWLKRRQKAA